MYYLPSKLPCLSFNILGDKRWGPNQPPPPTQSQKTKKSPVWIGLIDSCPETYLITTKDGMLSIGIQRNWKNFVNENPPSQRRKWSNCFQRGILMTSPLRASLHLWETRTNVWPSATRRFSPYSNPQQGAMSVPQRPGDYSTDVLSKQEEFLLYMAKKIA